MDHQAFAQLLGNYGEFVGAIAVVVTLGYLALEIRQENKESRAAAMHDIWTGFRESVSILGEPHASSVYTKALAQEELSDTEQMQLLVHIQNIFRIWEEAFLQWKQGRLDDDVWDSMLRQITHTMGSHPFTYVWQLRREVFGPAFQAFIETVPRHQYNLRQPHEPEQMLGSDDS